MTFTPPTYLDSHPESAGHKIPCDSPGCNRAVWPWVLQDMRSFPDVEGDFICDGCRSDWKRRLVPIDGGGPVATRREWLERLMAAHGAPEEALEKARALKETGFERTQREKANSSE